MYTNGRENQIHAYHREAKCEVKRRIDGIVNIYLFPFRFFLLRLELQRQRTLCPLIAVVLPQRYQEVTHQSLESSLVCSKDHNINYRLPGNIQTRCACTLRMNQQYKGRLSVIAEENENQGTFSGIEECSNKFR